MRDSDVCQMNICKNMNGMRFVKGFVETNILFFKGMALKWEIGNEQNVDFSMLDISQDSKGVW